MSVAGEGGGGGGDEAVDKINAFLTKNSFLRTEIAISALARTADDRKTKKQQILWTDSRE
jgi:hypothetical protein